MPPLPSLRWRPPLPPHLSLILCPSFRCESTAVPPPCQKPLFRSPPPPPVCLSVCIAGELKRGAPRLQAVASVIYKYENLLAQEISRANPSPQWQRWMLARGMSTETVICQTGRSLCLENGDDGWNSFQMLWNARVKLPSPTLECRVEPVTKGRPGSLRRPCSSQLINYHPVGSDTWRYYNGIWPHQPGTTEQRRRSRLNCCPTRRRLTANLDKPRVLKFIPVVFCFLHGHLTFQLPSPPFHQS